MHYDISMSYLAPEQTALKLLKLFFCLNTLKSFLSYVLTLLFQKVVNNLLMHFDVYMNYLAPEQTSVTICKTPFLDVYSDFFAF